MSHAPNEKEAVALNSIIVSLLMTIGKLIVGAMTGSLGLISEGVHSLLDFASTVMTYFAVRVSDKPADDRHPYGHGKVESVAALIETGLLFLTSAWVIYEAVKRLLTHDTKVEVTWWSAGVVVASIGLDLWRAGALLRVAKKTNSQALAADALHFSSDALSSGVVLIGLVAVAFGWKEGDAIASVGVAAFVCLAGWRLGRQTIDTLIDTAPEGAADAVRTILDNTPGVIRTNSVRVRPAGNVLFVAIDAEVNRAMALDRVARLRATVTESVQKTFPTADVSIMTHGVALDSETVHDRIALLAASHHLSVHHITVYTAADRLSVGFTLEVDGSLTMEAAHQIADHFEGHVRRELGDEVEVESHIEPLPEGQLAGCEGDETERAAIAALLDEASLREPVIRDVHDVRLRQTGKGLIVLFHCHADAAATVEAVHDAIDRIEDALKGQHLNLWRVFGHPEPQ